MLAAVEDLRRQDARAADKQLAAFEATLEHTIGALKALPPSAYDTTLGGRIMTLKEGEQDDTPALKMEPIFHLAKFGHWGHP